MNEIRLYGKNRRHPGKGRCYWTDIEAWVAQRAKATGKDPVTLNVTTQTGEWSRALSPILIGPTDTYPENGKMLRAVSVEVAWQYSKVYSHELVGDKLVPLAFQNGAGQPNAAWFRWRDAAWQNPKFHSGHPRFAANKGLVRRAYPRGSRVAAWYWEGKLMDAVTARREIYATLYCAAVRRMPEFQRLQALFAAGDVRIYDIDGYDHVALGMSPEDTIHDLDHSWGHGLLLTLMLSGVDPLSLGKTPRATARPAQAAPPAAIPMIPAPNPAPWSPKSANPIAFTEAGLPYGWLGNMSGGYPVEFKGVRYPSTEALFQCLRFPDDGEAQEAIRTATTFMAKKRARKRVKENPPRLRVPICDDADLARMKLCLVLKLAQNAQLIAPLMATGTADIIEDCTARPIDTEIDGKNHFGGKPFWGAKKTAAGWEGNNALGKIWMEIRGELQKAGESTAVSPQGDKFVVRKETPLGRGAFEEPPLVAIAPLTAAEARRLRRCEDRIEKGRKEVEQGFVGMVEAMHEVYRDRLYRDGGRTFAEYFRTKWQFERAHSYRLIHCGRLLQEMKGAVMGSLKSQAHFRPLLEARDDTVIGKALAQVEDWQKKLPSLEITPAVVAAAVAVVQPAAAAASDARKVKLAADDVLAVIDRAVANGTAAKPAAGMQLLENVRKEVETLARKGTTKIAWTDDTWNPLQGCSYRSEGCRYCYAAKLLATRMAAKFPGISEKAKGRKKDLPPYLFTGKIALLVRMLGEPLQERRPRRYFVNSLSDLFHEKVPDWFVDEVFAVMEKARWHEFQVLTKRPKRMADYTAKRYAKSPPPKNVWLGCTVENQQEHDRRIPDLSRVVTAVRWVSAEPLLSKVKFDLSGIHWVVVGGEKGGSRKMEKEWVADIQLQCRKAKVPFFFKQWGDVGEDGLPARPLPPGGHAAIDGRICQEYPVVARPTVNRECLLSILGGATEGLPFDPGVLQRWIQSAQDGSGAGSGAPLWSSAAGPRSVAGDLSYRVACPGGYFDTGKKDLEKVPKGKIAVSVQEMQADGKYKVVMSELFSLKELEQRAAQAEAEAAGKDGRQPAGSGKTKGP